MALPSTFRVHLLGLIGLVFLATGIGLLIAKGWNSDEWSMAAGMCVRIGMTLGALWLAFPQLVDLTSRVSPWTLAAIVIGLLIVVARPRTILFVAPVLLAIGLLQFVGWLFKPLPRKGAGSQERRETGDRRPE